MTYVRLRLLTILWIAGIIVLSLSPIQVKVAAQTETTAREPAIQSRVFTQHRLGHYLAFTVGAILLTAVGHRWRSRVLLCIGLACLGCLLEWLQHSLMGSILETWDMRDDTFAVLLGFSLSVVCRVPQYAPRPQTPVRA